MPANTPGPWIAESSGEWAPGYWQVHTATGKPRLIAQKLDEQDAHLIAAAPALLEMLKLLVVNEFGPEEKKAHRFIAARALLRDVEGESNG